ncbi:substrate-binding domain-containing protein [Candidatus Aalborgicola defluviihabitans]|uniref:substrate-binding domain-containing protein n=1 Tax=Candidatus Aalborgicola defluviihabitans TaxID=3386187 RepID=UPI001ED2FA6B|nr:hypothetical protein [Burkholderiales bacterium]
MDEGSQIERRYASSTAAAAALHDGYCDACGIHIPIGSQQARALEHYAQWFNDDDLFVVDIATRRQGLMVAPGNPEENLRPDRPRAGMSNSSTAPRIRAPASYWKVC